MQLINRNSYSCYPYITQQIFKESGQPRAAQLICSLLKDPSSTHHNPYCVYSLHSFYQHFALCIAWRSLQGKGNSHDSQSHAKTGVQVGSAGNDRRGSTGGNGNVSSTNGGSVDKGSHTSGNSLGRRDLGVSSGGLSGRRNITTSGGHCGNGDLRNSHSSRDGSDGAAARDGSSASDARLSDSSGDNNGGKSHGGSRRGSDGNDGGDGIGTSSNAGVLVDERSADALEESNGLRDGSVVSTKRVETVEDVVGELLAGAVASGIHVVLAFLLEMKPGVEALGDNVGARKGLSGLDISRSCGNTALLGRRRLLGLLGRLGVGASLGLSNRADSGADRNSDSDNSSTTSLDRAVGHGRLAAGDGRSRCGEDGRGSLVGGDNSCDMGSDRSGLLNGSARLLDLGSRDLRLGGNLGLGRGLRLGRGLNGLGVSASLSDGADGGADRDSHGHNCGTAAGDRAVGDGGSTAADGLSGSGENSRGSLVGGNESGSGRLGAGRLRVGLSAAGLDSALLAGEDRRGLVRRGGGGSRLGACRRLRSLDAGGLVLAAIKLDGVNLDTTGLLSRRVLVLGVDNLDGLGTTALLVDNGGSSLGALAAVLAGAAIRHAVVEFETSVKLGGDVVALDRESTNLRASRDHRVLSLLIATGARDGLVAKGTSSKRVVALGRVLDALPALEVAALVLSDITDGDIVPIVTGNLNLDTFVVGVAGASERAGASEGTKVGVEANAAKLLKALVSSGVSAT